MKFQIYKDVIGQYRWRLRAGNHKIIAVCSEGYYNKSDCQRGIAIVLHSSSYTPIEDLT